MAGHQRDHVLKVRTEIDNGAVVRPGDKLVVGIASHVDMATAVAMKGRFRELLPGVEIVIIGQCSGLAVYRDEPSIIHVEETLSAEEAARIRAELAETLPGE